MANPLRVTLLHKPLDRIASPIASLPVFCDTKPLRSAVGLVDWRLNGKLSQLIQSERLCGDAGECLLMPSHGRLQAETLLLYGLGQRERWDPGQAETHFAAWIEKLEALQQDKWLLSFSGLTDDFRGWRHGLRSFVNTVAYRTDRKCRQLLCAERDDWVLEAKKRHMDFGENVILQFDLSSV